MSKVFDKWQAWRFLDIGDSQPALTTLEPSAFLTAKANAELIDVSDYEEIAVAIFSSAADNDILRTFIYGWNDNGPGELLVNVLCTAGVQSFQESPVPDSIIPRLAVSWRPIDTLAFTVNVTEAVAAVTTTTPAGGYFRMPTKGWKYFQARVLLTAGGPNPDRGSVIWRPTILAKNFRGI